MSDSRPWKAQIIKMHNEEMLSPAQIAERLKQEHPQERTPQYMSVYRFLRRLGLSRRRSDAMRAYHHGDKFNSKLKAIERAEDAGIHRSVIYSRTGVSEHLMRKVFGLKRSVIHRSKIREKLAWAYTQHANGMHWQDIAKEIGIAPSTLHAWRMKVNSLDLAEDDVCV